MTHGESPMADKVAPEWRDKVIHVHMTVGNRVLMGSDVLPSTTKSRKAFPSHSALKMSPSPNTFSKLSKGGDVPMPLQKTFWSASFAMFTDRFGIPWMVNCEKAS